MILVFIYWNASCIYIGLLYGLLTLWPLWPRYAPCHAQLAVAIELQRQNPHLSSLNQKDQNNTILGIEQENQICSRPCP